MRPDMAQVLVERPRPDSRDRGRPRKGYQKRLRYQMMNDGGSPTKEGMRRPYLGWIQFNEHLGPLRRYLHSQVGRPWNKVHSEICAHIDRGNVVQKHILTHLYDYVTLQPEWIDGKAHYPPGSHWRHSLFVHSVIEGRDQFYVNRQGILCRAKETPLKGRYLPSWRRGGKKREHYWISATELVRQRDDGMWELFTMKRLPDAFFQPYQYQSVHDVLLQARLSPDDTKPLQQYYGKPFYAVASRLISKHELKLLPLPYNVLRQQPKLPNIVR